MEICSVALLGDVHQRNPIPSSRSLAENVIQPTKVQHAGGGGGGNRFQDAWNSEGGLGQREFLQTVFETDAEGDYLG